MRALSCLLLFSAVLSPACTTTRTCKDQTVLVTVTLTGGAEQADQLDVTVEITGGATVRANGLQHLRGAATGTLQIEFPRGYPAQQQIRVVLAALIGGDIVGVGENSLTLPSSCATLDVAINAVGDLGLSDLSTADLSGRDLASITVDLRNDLATRPQYDLTLPVVDLAGQSCGTVGSYCCPGNVCQGSRCTNSICQSDCGGPGQPCCQGTSCAPGFVCNGSSVCVLCGVPGEACCARNDCGSGCCENGSCVGAGDSCANGMACSNGACGSCGAKNAPCCANRQCTAPGTLCIGAGVGTCGDCGGNGQNCCLNNTCVTDNVCSGGICSACTPVGCTPLNSLCGPTPRSCGGPIECGGCTPPAMCQFAGGKGRCQ